MSMSLKRVGGAQDGGIDLMGWWWLPTDRQDASKHQENHISLLNRRRIRVIGQCKAEKKKMGPNYVRELEGVLFRLLASPGSITFYEEWSADTLSLKDSDNIPMVALLVSESVFTKAALLRAHSSPIPFLLLHLPPVETQLPSSEGSAGSDTDSPLLGNLGAAICNPALCGLQGLLKGQLEVRWERYLMDRGQGRETEYAGRPTLWWLNKSLPNSVPDLGDVIVSPRGQDRNELKTLEESEDGELGSEPLLAV